MVEKAKTNDFSNQRTEISKYGKQIKLFVIGGSLRKWSCVHNKCDQNLQGQMQDNQMSTGAIFENFRAAENVLKLVSIQGKDCERIRTWPDVKKTISWR